LPEYLTPGLYVEEVDSGSKPIEGVGMTTAAFIGYAKSGEFNTPTLVTSWTEFVKLYGEDDNKILKPLSDELGMTPGEIMTEKRARRRTFSDYVDQKLKERPTAAAKDYRGFCELHKVDVVPNPYFEGSYLAYSVNGFFSNGGTKAYIVRVARDEDKELFSHVPPQSALTAKAATASLGCCTVRAIESGKKGNDIQVQVEHKGDGDEFVITVKDGGGQTFTLPPKPTDKPLTPGSLRAGTKIGPVEIGDVVATAERPAATIFEMMGGMDVTTAAKPTRLDAEVKRIDTEDFIGDEAKRSGARGLSEIEDINFICAPDLMAGLMMRDIINDRPVGPERVDYLDEKTKKKRDEILGFQKLLIDYCELSNDRIAIIDSLPDLTPQQVRDAVVYDSKFTCKNGQAALYYPWLKVPDMVNRKEKGTVLVPPCGHVAGLWARTIMTRGVHKAPANEGVMGVVDVERQITKVEQSILNPEGINCIRAFPNSGIKVWGARTLATVGNPSWRYVNVRALFNYLEKSMERNLQWTVFEPNDEDLWDRVRRTISAFLFTEWKEGKLFGAVPEEAYYVKCNRETNPQEMIDLGRLYVEVGVNPVKPAEFVIIRMGQWAGGAEKSES